MRTRAPWLVLATSLVACSPDDPTRPAPTGTEETGDTGATADTDEPVDDRRVVGAFVLSARFAWDADAGTHRSYFVDGAERAPELQVTMGEQDWDFDIGGTDFCTLTLDLSSSVAAAPSAADDVWGAIDYEIGPTSDDCEGWNYALLFGIGEPATALAASGLRIGIGGPLDELTAAALPAELRPNAAGGTYDGFLALPPSASAYTFGFEVDDDFGLVSFEEGGVLVEVEEMAPAGDLANGIYRWYSTGHRFAG